MKELLFHQGVLTPAVAAEEARRFLSEPLNHSAAFAELTMVEEKETLLGTTTPTRKGGGVCGYSDSAFRGGTHTGSHRDEQHDSCRSPETPPSPIAGTANRQVPHQESRLPR